MRVLCHREGLLAACQLASVAVTTRDVKPVLRNLKAIADDGRCTLMATDLELGIRLDVQGLTIEEPGEAILPAAKLVAILREARDDQLSIEADPTACVSSAQSTGRPVAMRRMRPAMRTAKNSSSALAKIAANLQRSSRGTFGSSASSRTRWANRSQLSSRSRYRSAGRSRARLARAACSASCCCSRTAALDRARAAAC